MLALDPLAQRGFFAQHGFVTNGAYGQIGAFLRLSIH